MSKIKHMEYVEPINLTPRWLHIDKEIKKVHVQQVIQKLKLILEEYMC